MGFTKREQRCSRYANRAPCTWSETLPCVTCSPPGYAITSLLTPRPMTCARGHQQRVHAHALYMHSRQATAGRGAHHWHAPRRACRTHHTRHKRPLAAKPTPLHAHDCQAAHLACKGGVHTSPRAAVLHAACRCAQLAVTPAGRPASSKPRSTVHAPCARRARSRNSSRRSQQPQAAGARLTERVPHVLSASHHAHTRTVCACVHVLQHGHARMSCGGSVQCSWRNRHAPPWPAD